MKTRILIIDDEADFTQLLQLNLELTGRYEVAVVNASNLAVCTAHAFSPDVILLDVMMPELNGGDILARLESQDTLRQIPVIFVTGLVEPEEAQRHCKRKQEPPTLSKPVDLDLLERTVADQLDSVMA